jgi:hypothetical protein
MHVGYWWKSQEERDHYEDQDSNIHNNKIVFQSRGCFSVQRTLKTRVHQKKLEMAPDAHDFQREGKRREERRREENYLMWERRLI